MYSFQGNGETGKLGRNKNTWFEDVSSKSNYDNITISSNILNLFIKRQTARLNFFFLKLRCFRKFTFLAKGLERGKPDVRASGRKPRHFQTIGDRGLPKAALGWGWREEGVQGQARRRTDGHAGWLQQADLEGLPGEDRQLYAGRHLHVGGG